MQDQYVKTAEHKACDYQAVVDKAKERGMENVAFMCRALFEQMDLLRQEYVAKLKSLFVTFEDEALLSDACVVVGTCFIGKVQNVHCFGIGADEAKKALLDVLKEDVDA